MEKLRKELAGLKKVIISDNQYTSPVLSDVIEDSYARLIAPAIEREIRSDLTEKAEDGAIEVFVEDETGALEPETTEVVEGNVEA